MHEPMIPTPVLHIRTPAERWARRMDWKFIEAERLAKLGPSARELYRRLTAMRGRLARAAGIPAYHILTNRLILDISEANPQDEAGLLAIDGFGQLRLKAYGAEILAVTRPA